MSVDERLVLEERRGWVALLRLNRPRVLNALNEDLLRALTEAVERADRDDEVGCLVLSGSGRAFSAGGDLTAMLEMERDRDRFRSFILLLQRLSLTMRRLSKPTVAAINGYCLAGGFELAIQCDLRFAGDSTVFGLPDTPLGLSPTSGMTWLLPRIVGRGWAMHLALSGERIDARQAERIGLVTRVVPDASLLDTALETAARLADSPPLGLQHTRQGIDLASDRDFETALDAEVEAEVACFEAEQVQANLRAFRDRRRQPRSE